MENKNLNILLIDDHPLTTSGYASAFKQVSKEDETLSFKFNVAHNCDEAFEKIDYFSKHGKSLDIAFLDIQLPPSKDGKIISGEDLGLKIKALLPQTKIVIITSFTDNYRIHSLFQSLNPDGFLVKNDTTPKELVTAIQHILAEPPYYSKSVLKLLRKEVTNDLLLDDIDRKMLYELSRGTMMKELPDIVFISLPALEKRKGHLKQIFDVEGINDKKLLLKAEEKGFI